ncbi:YbfB/YjiJ family MFS transporter [Acidovorax soli]|uniref:YbfB/YjiJ family MFS transporter n=1 Tax=Acidovorax TaxID=12916 RepID=UPI0026F06B3B|nr:YbfB/YjiJ family MFS transporter [Acidovorax soli]MCM2347422.1 YbfB/YjiJ family MFS transporter [Acidovorax soli]
METNLTRSLQGLRAHPVGVVLALSLGAAVSLGITRFAYALLLPVMREDLGWSYTLAGAMNTFNALGYLLGALVAPALLRRLAPGTLLLGGAVLATLFMALSGFFLEAAPLLLQRLLAGVASAVIFIAGGLMAARLGALDVGRSGLLLGLYYGGVGWGISASALLVPPVLALAPALHGWTWAWWALAAVCALATVVLVWPVRALRVLTASAPAPAAGMGVGAKVVAGPAAPPAPVPLRALAPALLGYTLFGVGYIGYMTFVVALLREQGMASGTVTLFYALLGLAVVLSSRVWAGLLDRSRGGRALALLNGLLGVATLLPALTSVWPVVMASGLLFGGVFLAVVASTTALVRHNLPPAQWAGGISAFTVVFAAGQIVGPTVVGWIADGPGGLARGLVYSAVALWLGALVAARQRPL